MTRPGAQNGADGVEAKSPSVVVGEASGALPAADPRVARDDLTAAPSSPPPAPFSSIPDVPGGHGAERPSPHALTGPAAASPPDPARDMGALVDRLLEVRQALRHGDIRLAVAHREFGAVGVRFEPPSAAAASLASGGMGIVLTNSDPAFAAAVAAGVAEWRGGEARAAPPGDPARPAGAGTSDSAGHTAAHGHADGRHADGQPTSSAGHGRARPPHDPIHPNRSQPAAQAPHDGVQGEPKDGLYA